MIDNNINRKNMINGAQFYQHHASQTAIYPNEHVGTYPILGLLGEAGELANKYKKVLRDGTELNEDDLAAELGDIIWYVSAIASDFGLELGLIMNANLIKLKDRQNRGTLRGSGDNR